MAGNGNLANLQNATAARTAAAQARAETALDSMITADEPVTFRSLATRAGVCLDFLYRNTQIRARVERHRAAQPSRPRTDDLDLPRPGQPGAVIRTLTAQLADLNAAPATRPPRCGRHSKPPTGRTCCSAAASASAVRPMRKHPAVLPATPDRSTGR